MKSKILQEAGLTDLLKIKVEKQAKSAVYFRRGVILYTLVKKLKE